MRSLRCLPATLEGAVAGDAGGKLRPPCHTGAEGEVANRAAIKSTTGPFDGTPATHATWAGATTPELSRSASADAAKQLGLGRGHGTFAGPGADVVWIHFGEPSVAE